MSKKVLEGGKLAGGNPKKKRVEYDYYATNPKALEMLLEKYEFKGDTFLEPCVGAGHLANVIKQQFPDAELDCVDIIDRGYPNTIVTDFLTWETDKKYDCIITNPPYSLGKEFVERGMALLNDSGQMAMFLKIQFLESGKRREMYKKYPPKYIYVFTDRMATWNNGQERDSNGKKWQTTFCHAWFIWEKGSNTEPVVRWL